MERIIKNSSSVIDSETEKTVKSNAVSTIIRLAVVRQHCISRCHFRGNMYLSYLRNLELFEINTRTTVEEEETQHGKIRCIPYNPARLFGRRACRRCLRQGYIV